MKKSKRKILKAIKKNKGFLFIILNNGILSNDKNITKKIISSMKQIRKASSIYFQTNETTLIYNAPKEVYLK